MLLSLSSKIACWSSVIVVLCIGAAAAAAQVAGGATATLAHVHAQRCRQRAAEGSTEAARQAGSRKSSLQIFCQGMCTDIHVFMCCIIYNF